VAGKVRRSLTVTLVVLAFLLVLVGVADRVGAHYAETLIAQRVSEQLTKRQIQSAPPEVTITGYPFLTQVLAGNYDEIQVDLRDVKAERLPIPLLKVRAHDVRADAREMINGTGKVIATKIDGTATLSYTSLVEASGLKDVTMSGDGTNLRISGNVPAAGVLTGVAEVTVVDGRVRIRVKELTAANLTPAAQQLINQYRDRLSGVTFSLPPMPFNLKLVDVDPALGGLDVTMSTSEVELAG
jgi:hypothetical protein